MSQDQGRRERIHQGENGKTFLHGSLEINFLTIKLQDLMLIRKFVHRMKGSKSKKVNGQKAEKTWALVWTFLGFLCEISRLDGFEKSNSVDIFLDYRVSRLCRDMLIGTPFS